MVRLQAVARAGIERAAFQAHHIALKRPLRLRVVSAHNLAAADFVVPALVGQARREGLEDPELLQAG